MTVNWLSSAAGVAIIGVVGGIVLELVKRYRPGRNKLLDGAAVLQGLTLDMSKELREQLDDTRHELVEARAELTHLRSQMTELEGRFDELLKRARDAEAENQTLRSELAVWRAQHLGPANAPTSTDTTNGTL